MSLQRPPSRLIPILQAKSLLQADAEWIEIEGFSPTSDPRFFRHKDGRGLLTSKHSRKAELFESAQAFLDLRELLKRTAPQHILAGLIPNDGRFIDRVDEYIAQFATTCSIPDTLLDRSLESLDTLEIHLRKVAKDRIANESVFSGMVAYLGEVMRVAMQGQWIMRLSEQDKVTWEPWIVDREGKGCTPIVLLWDKYVEGKTFSLKGATIIEMNHRVPIVDKI